MQKPSSRPLLYTYRRCPYAMRARMALLVADIAFDAHDVILRDKPAALLAASPKGTVPVLVLPDGQVLEQSWDIVQWALSHDQTSAEVQSWWSRAQTPDNLALLRCNDGDFKHHLDRYKYPERFTAEDSASAAATDRRVGHRDQAVAVLLERLEHRLAEQPFLGGAQPCATDFGIFPFVRQFAAVNPAWFETLPLWHVKRWLADWLQSPLFETCMHKLPSNFPELFPVPIKKSLVGWVAGNPTLNSL
ncbi:MAG: glutathione S-transferase [Giesbergeria sp.]|uniref:glutathione S-transferase n=1 Tax=Giesbergeria sp. TaxID=2818473 RepID=UPI0026099A3D|nr:glutathione S-transferase [Giesbergeria sp.]MDD2609898.1 glutathione S-transferase [Giesbergeria sp.]